IERFFRNLVEELQLLNQARIIRQNTRGHGRWQKANGKYDHPLSHLPFAICHLPCSSHRSLRSLVFAGIWVLSASSIASALCSVSSYSRCRTESATMPAPTGKEILFLSRKSVRIKILNVRSPLNPIQPREPVYGPRLCGSSLWMISIARIFGHPVMVPPGKLARKRSSQVFPGTSVPRT